MRHHNILDASHKIRPERQGNAAAVDSDVIVDKERRQQLGSLIPDFAWKQSYSQSRSFAVQCSELKPDFVQSFVARVRLKANYSRSFFNSPLHPRLRANYYGLAPAAFNARIIPRPRLLVIYYGLAPAAFNTRIIPRPRLQVNYYGLAPAAFNTRIIPRPRLLVIYYGLAPAAFAPG